MALEESIACARAGGRAHVRTERIEAALKRFDAKIASRVRACAARDPRLADLAVSFPALLVALALPRGRGDAARAAALVIAGGSLVDAAEIAATPLWLRKLAPAAFDAPLPALPDGAVFRRQIPNLVPQKRVPEWLRLVAKTAEMGDENIALWFAREGLKAKTPRRRRYWKRTYLGGMSLYAWFSQRPDTAAGKLIETRWRPEMQWKSAADAEARWNTNLYTYLCMGDAPISDAWFEADYVHGYSFMPLLTAEDVRAEARAMNNCLRTYGSDIASNHCRVWSMRQKGERVATLELTAPQDRMATISQIRVPGDKQAPAEICRAARAWMLKQHDAVQFAEHAYTPHETLCRRAWEKLWKPYWMEKRHIPDWLPLAPNQKKFDAL